MIPTSVANVLHHRTAGVEQTGVSVSHGPRWSAAPQHGHIDNAL